MAGDPVIRELRKADAPAVARLQIAINPHRIETPELAWHRASRSPARGQRRDWVAEVDGALVGHARASFGSVPTTGKAHFWIGVPTEHRGRGIGAELYRQVEEYLRAEGAWRLRTWVDADPAGERFVRQRGFEHTGVDRVSEADPRQIDLSDLPGLEAACAAAGFRLAPLSEVRDRVEDLFEIRRQGELDMPSDEPESALDFEGWQWDELEHPNLSDEGSFVALAGEQAVSLAFLTVDPERRIAYNQMTATLPQFRRRGLALLVKLAAARWAAANGIERLLTENDRENVGMLALNDRLGYRPLYLQEHFVRET